MQRLLRDWPCLNGAAPAGALVRQVIRFDDESHGGDLWTADVSTDGGTTWWARRAVLQPETVDRGTLLAALAAAALASDDPLGAVDEMREALRGRVLAATLDAAGWNLNETARRLGLSTSGVRKILRGHHPELAAEARAKGPLQIGSKKV